MKFPKSILYSLMIPGTGIMLLWMLHCVIYAPCIEDPFNLHGRKIHKDYYLYHFWEGGNMFVLWKKYSPLPCIPFDQAVSSMIWTGNHIIFVSIDHQWYEINMETDAITEISHPDTQALPQPSDVVYKQL